MTPSRRGACPSLSRPMPTGDGLLVRLNPRGGALSPAQLGGVAEAAREFGNGLLEITARGSLQIRGLSAESAPRFAQGVAALGIEAAEGVEVRVGALAGLDAAEIADPRPLAEAVRAGIRDKGLAARLGAKVSVTVDGGGALSLSGILADVKLEAGLLGSGAVWNVRAGSIFLGCGDAGRAAAATLAVLDRLAQRGRQARAKDLSAADLRDVSATLEMSEAVIGRDEARLPVGHFPLKGGNEAHGFALAFGQVSAESLIRFCDAVSGDAGLRLAPGRGLLVVGCIDEGLRAAAARSGFVADADDLRLKIAACAGAPGCASAWLDTKGVAARLANDGRELLRCVPMLHLSGCPKGCAKPAGRAVSLIGSEHGPKLSFDGAFLDERSAGLLKSLAEGIAERPKVPA